MDHLWLDHLQAPKYLLNNDFKKGSVQNVDGVVIFVVLVYDKKFFLTSHILEFKGLHFFVFTI